MTFTELASALIARGVNPDAIAINETPVDCQYCIQFDGEMTEVFRFERGIKGDLVTFRDASAGMEHFQAMVLADQSAYFNGDGNIRSSGA